MGYLWEILDSKWKIRYHHLPSLGRISSLWHSEHWAEITLCQHLLRPSQSLVFIKLSDSPCPLQFWVDRSLWAVTAASGCCRARVRTVRLKLGTSWPSNVDSPPGPQSHSFSRSYGTILPTSLIYIILVGQRLLTLETWCGCGYDLECSAHLGFHGPSRAHLTKYNHSALPVLPPYLGIIPFQGRRTVKKKRELFQRLAPAFPGSLMLPFSPLPAWTEY